MMICAIQPFIVIGGGSLGLLLSWLITLVLVAVAVYFVIYLVTKFAGPPNIPEPARWIIWIIVAIALLILIFAAVGVRL